MSSTELTRPCDQKPADTSSNHAVRLQIDINALYSSPCPVRGTSTGSEQLPQLCIQGQEPTPARECLPSFNAPGGANQSSSNSEMQKQTQGQVQGQVQSQLQGQACTSADCSWRPDPTSTAPLALAWDKASQSQEAQPISLGKECTYTVKFGDCLDGIAGRELRGGGVSDPTQQQIDSEVNQIVHANDSRYHSLDCNPDLIKTGWTLDIPGICSTPIDCSPVAHNTAEQQRAEQLCSSRDGISLRSLSSPPVSDQSLLDLFANASLDQSSLSPSSRVPSDTTQPIASQTPAGSDSSFPAPPGDLNVNGPPTLTPAKIQQILDSYNSPAAKEPGLAQYVYDQGVKYGINPAVALAFFVHESSAGTTGVATATRGWGNERATPNDPGPAGATDGFRGYNNFHQSVDAWYQLIKDTYMAPKSQGGYGVHTVDQILPIYAPSSDHNSPNSYAATVISDVQKWATA